MSKKNIFVLVGIVIVGLVAVLLLTKGNKSLDQIVYEDTLNLSKGYLTLRYKTDNVLMNAEEYKEYDAWNKDMTNIIKEWSIFENSVSKLEKNADKLSNEKVAFNFIEDVYAYDSKEVQQVIESAPMGKQIRTLAQHFGVDAKKAQLILNESQDRIQREVWGGEGDVYEGLEQDAMRVKNGCKVAGFVGGVVLTGGASAVMASGALAKTALVVGGADLVLEITADEAQIALGDKNKVSEMVGKLRTVTEPAASILTLVNIPGNVSKAMEKINAVSFGIDQIRSVVQDEKILGISIKVDEKGEIKAEATSLTEAELPAWKKENNIEKSAENLEEILGLKKEVQSEKEKDTITGKQGNILGTWNGKMKWTPGYEEPEQSQNLSLVFNSNGTIKVNEGKWGATFWTQDGNSIKLSTEKEAIFWYEFTLENNTLNFKVLEGPDSEDSSKWTQTYAGSDFFGGKFYEITLTKE